jgi:prepilin peptidase CpaA
MSLVISTIALVIFPLLMAFAAFSDLFTMRISNRLVLVLVAAFFALALFVGLPLADIGMHLACAAVVLVFAFAFFAFGWIGGGDAKLIAATTLWLGLGIMLPYLIYASLLGGALTLLLLAARRYPLPEQLRAIKWIDRLHDSKTGVPYGIALAIAGLLVYSDTAIFQSFLA